MAARSRERGARSSLRSPTSKDQMTVPNSHFMDVDIQTGSSSSKSHSEDPAQDHNPSFMDHPPPAEPERERAARTTPQADRTPAYRLQSMFSGHTRSICAVKFSPCGKMLASCGGWPSHSFVIVLTHLCTRKPAADRLVKVWDVEEGELLHTLEGHTEGISDVAWSNDGEFLASASDDKTVRIWSIQTVRRLMSCNF